MNYYLERASQAVITVLAVVTISFGLIRLMPGGPMDYVRAQLLKTNPEMTQAELEQMIAVYTSVQPDEPVWVQYVNYMGSILQGDFGESIYFQESVAGIIAEALPWTVFLMSSALLITYVAGIVLGAAIAYREGSRFDVAASSVATLLNSIPYYLVAIVLLFVFAYHQPVFPTGGRMDPDTTVGLNVPFLKGVLEHSTLPILSMVVTGFGISALRMRANSISVLGSDYLRVARLRGLSSSRIANRYVARNAILPMYTDFMIGLGTVFGGSIILEEIFNYYGLGYYTLQAVYARDYPLMMAGFIVLTVAIVLGILIADLTYGWIDPRAGGGDREAY